jgi:hypothetical protein
LQKSGLSAKLNLCTFFTAKTIFYLQKKCKLANKKNGFAYVGAKLKLSAFFPAPSQTREPLATIL